MYVAMELYTKISEGVYCLNSPQSIDLLIVYKKSRSKAKAIARVLLSTPFLCWPLPCPAPTQSEAKCLNISK